LFKEESETEKLGKDSLIEERMRADKVGLSWGERERKNER
jgi:hypothetical protein